MAGSQIDDADLWRQAARGGPTVIDQAGQVVEDRSFQPQAMSPVNLSPDMATVMSLLANQGGLGMLSPIVVGLMAYGGMRALPRSQVLGGVIGAVLGYELVIYIDIQNKARQAMRAVR